MKKALLAPLAAALVFAGIGPAQAGQIEPFDSCLNINGTIYDIGIDCAEFDGAAPGNVTDDIETNFLAPDSGLGSVSITLDEVGDFFVGLFVDWEIDEFFNGFDNEDFASGGTPAAGQTFEVDEPGYAPLTDYAGDIFFNFQDGLLDNAFLQDFFFGDSGNAPEDISLALGWDFSLTAGQSAIVTFLLSDTEPGSGFWLSHIDAASEVEFYFSSTLEISGDEPEPQPVPEPGTLFLLGGALLGLSLARRRATSI